MRHHRGMRKLALIPVDSTKNIFQTISVANGSSAVINDVIVNAVESSTALMSQQGANVEQSCSVRYMSGNVMIYGSGTGDVTPASCIITIHRLDKGTSLPVNADLTSAGSSQLKDRLFHIEQAIPGPIANGALPMNFRWALKVPPRFRKMDIGDRWVVSYTVNGVVWSACAFAVYKWYR